MRPLVSQVSSGHAPAAPDGGTRNAAAIDDVRRLFRSLQAMAKAMTSEGGPRDVLDHERFEHLFDHLVISRPHPTFSRSRFDFCGAAVAEMSRMGDVTGASFGDVMIDEPSRKVMADYRHLGWTKVGTVARNHPVIGDDGPYFTRMVLPLFHRDKIALMIGALLFHPVPLPVAGEAGLRG